MLLSLPIYGYGDCVLSRGKTERATCYSVAFRLAAIGSHPDHDTPATPRQQLLEELSGLSVLVPEMAARTLDPSCPASKIPLPTPTDRPTRPPISLCADSFRQRLIRASEFAPHAYGADWRPSPPTQPP